MYRKDHPTKVPCALRGYLTCGAASTDNRRPSDRDCHLAFLDWISRLKCPNYHCRQEGFKSMESFSSHVSDCVYLLETDYWCSFCCQVEHLGVEECRGGSFVVNDSNRDSRLKRAGHFLKRISCVRCRNPIKKLQRRNLGFMTNSTELGANAVYPHGNAELATHRDAGLIPDNFSIEETPHYPNDPDDFSYVITEKPKELYRLCSGEPSSRGQAATRSSGTLRSPDGNRRCPEIPKIQEMEAYYPPPKSASNPSTLRGRATSSSHEDAKSQRNSRIGLRVSTTSWPLENTPPAYSSGQSTASDPKSSNFGIDSRTIPGSSFLEPSGSASSQRVPHMPITLGRHPQDHSVISPKSPISPISPDYAQPYNQISENLVSPMTYLTSRRQDSQHSAFSDPQCAEMASPFDSVRPSPHYDPNSALSSPRWPRPPLGIRRSGLDRISTTSIESGLNMLPIQRHDSQHSAFSKDGMPLRPAHIRRDSDDSGFTQENLMGQTPRPHSLRRDSTESGFPVDILSGFTQENLTGQPLRPHSLRRDITESGFPVDILTRRPSQHQPINSDDSNVSNVSDPLLSPRPLPHPSFHPGNVQGDRAGQRGEMTLHHDEDNDCARRPRSEQILGTMMEPMIEQSPILTEYIKTRAPPEYVEVPIVYRKQAQEELDLEDSAPRDGPWPTGQDLQTSSQQQEVPITPESHRNVGTVIDQSSWPESQISPDKTIANDFQSALAQALPIQNADLSQRVAVQSGQKLLEAPIPSTQALVKHIHQVMRQVKDQWEEYSRKRPDFGTFLAVLNTSFRLNDGLERLQKYLSGKPPTTLEEVVALVQFAYACASTSQHEDNHLAWSAFYRNALQWGKVIADWQDCNRFLSIAHLLWRIKPQAIKSDYIQCDYDQQSRGAVVNACVRFLDTFEYADILERTRNTLHSADALQVPNETTCLLLNKMIKPLLQHNDFVPFHHLILDARHLLSSGRLHNAREVEVMLVARCHKHCQSQHLSTKYVKEVTSLSDSCMSWPSLNWRDREGRKHYIRQVQQVSTSLETVQQSMGLPNGSAGYSLDSVADSSIINCTTPSSTTSSFSSIPYSPFATPATLHTPISSTSSTGYSSTPEVHPPWTETPNASSLVTDIPNTSPSESHGPMEPPSPRSFCRSCGAAFKGSKGNRNSNLRRHVRTAHRTGPRLSCNNCGKLFQRSDYLKQHYKIKHGIERDHPIGSNNLAEKSSKSLNPDI